MNKPLDRDVQGIGSEPLRIRDLFAPGERLCMPPYQRSYSWGEREAMALLADLIDCAEDGSTHFIGAIVVNLRGKTGLQEIVDGQQRLTTLTILLAVLRDMEPKAQRAEALHTLIADRAQPETGESVVWRISLNHLDGAFFRAHIQTPGQAARTEDDPGDSESQRRISTVAASYLRELGRLDADTRRALAETIADRCTLVRVSVRDRDMGYKVFRILNTRGKEPNAHDIVKTELFERADFDVREADTYATLWSDYEARLGGSAFDELLRQIRALYDRAPKGDLIAGFRKTVLNRISPQELLTELLPRYVRAYEEISTGRVEFGEASTEVGDYLNRMRALDHQGWRAPALKYLVERRTDEARAPEFFRRLERLAYVLQLIVHKRDQRDKRYRRVIDALHAERQLFSANGPLAITPDEARRVRERLLGRFATFNQRRAMALRLNAALADGQTLPPEADATVEHVLPRNPDPASHWLTTWPDPAKRREYCDTLGNFVLLPHELNQQADRMDYRDKKKVYFNGNGAPFALTRDLADQDAWTAEIVRHRTERLAEILCRHWDLPDV